MHSQGMYDSVPTVRQRAIKLKRRIRQAAIRGAAGARTSRVLIAEPGPPRWPERVLSAPELEPVDKMVWMALRQCAPRGQFPSYAQVGRAANVSSKSTVSRAIAILRAARWLARCGERVTRGTSLGTGRKTGRKTGRRTNNRANLVASRRAGVVVYVLHDAPLAVADTLYVDGGYLNFLQFAQAHPHARVRRVVQGVLASLRDNRGRSALRAGNAR